MGLVTRARAAVRAAVGIFSGRKRDPQGLMSGVFPVGRGEPPDLSTRNLLESYETMPWVRAIAGRVATRIAETQWVLRAPLGPDGKAVRHKSLQRASLNERQRLTAALQKSQAIRDITDHPMLDTLSKAPNPLMTGFDVLKLAQLALDLVGDAFLVKERNALGVPIGLWPVPSHWVIGTPTPTLPVFFVSYNAWRGEIPDTEILWLHDPTAANPYGRGAGVARALGDELETDEYAAKHAKQLFFNRARPDFLVQMDGAIDSEVARVEKAWTSKLQGFWRVAKPYFLNRKVDIHEFTSTNLSDLTLVPLRQFERDIILQTWGFPPEILGILENANRSTIEAADYFLEKHVIEPRREFLRAALQARLAPEYDERLVVDYVTAIQRDKEFDLKVMSKAPWAWSADEWRARIGDEPLPAGAGRAFLVPLNSYMTRDPLDPETRPAPHPAGAPGAPADEPPEREPKG